MHKRIAFQASMLGWLHYERGEYEEALAYYRDAQWTWRIVEYQILIGMALEAMGTTGLLHEPTSTTSNVAHMGSKRASSPRESRRSTKPLDEQPTHQASWASPDGGGRG